MTDDHHTIEALPSVIPVFPLSGVILLPGTSLPLNIFEPRYLKMVRDAAAGDGLIGMIQPLHGTEGTRPELYATGGVGSLSDMRETDDGRLLIRLKGLSRFSIADELAVTTPYRQVRADWAPFADDPWGGKTGGEVERDKLMGSLKRYLDTRGLNADLDAIATAPDDVLVNTLSMIVPLAPREKQALLEAETILTRCALLENLLDMAASGTNTDDHGTAH